MKLVMCHAHTPHQRGTLQQHSKPAQHTTNRDNMVCMDTDPKCGWNLVQSALRPVIRLTGGEGNGTDLFLPANLTDDKRALLASTPVEKSPYAAGSHQIHISLNGQQFVTVNATAHDPLQGVVGQGFC